jgi:hypothetical protein
MSTIQLGVPNLLVDTMRAKRYGAVQNQFNTFSAFKMPATP